MEIGKKNKNKKFWSFKALDENTGELILYGEISSYSWWGDEITPKQFKEDLDALGDIDTLNVYVNSPGGDVFAGQTIHSILKRHKATVNIYVDGLAASIASIVAMSGDTITMPKNTMMMIHNPWTWMAGNANEFRKMADDLDKIRESMISAYLDKAEDKLDRDKLVELLDAETWLTADECLEYGLCDAVDEPNQVAACVYDSILARYKNVPKEYTSKKQGPPAPPQPDPPAPTPDNALIKQKLLLELEL